MPNIIICDIGYSPLEASYKSWVYPKVGEVLFFKTSDKVRRVTGIAHHITTPYTIWVITVEVRSDTDKR